MGREIRYVILNAKPLHISSACQSAFNCWTFAAGICFVILGNFTEINAPFRMQMEIGRLVTHTFYS